MSGVFYQFENKEEKMELDGMVQQEYERLMAQKKELMDKMAEVDKQLAPILAFMSAGKKKEPGIRKRRGRKPKGVETPEVV